MKDRLIELLENSLAKYNLTENIADELLADGWMRPPCKVGDTVYYVHKSEHKITTHKVTNIYVGKSMTISAKGLWSTIKPHEFGWLFYTSKEEAEKALKGGAEE